jgi:Fic family protein
MLQAAHATAGTFTLLDRLFQNPYLTIPSAQEWLGVSFPTAQRAVEYLEEAGIVQETTGQQRNKRFRASEILETIEIERA